MIANTLYSDILLTFVEVNMENSGPVKFVEVNFGPCIDMLYFLPRRFTVVVNESVYQTNYFYA